MARSSLRFMLVVSAGLMPAAVAFVAPAGPARASTGGNLYVGRTRA